MNKDLKDKVRFILNSYLIYKNEIKNIDLEIEEIINNYEITAIEYKEKTAATNKITKEIEERISNKDDKIKYLKLLRKNNIIKCDKIENAVNSRLKEFERDVIKTKYMEIPIAWDMVARKLGYTKAACKKAEGRAIIKMMPILLKEYEYIKSI